MLSVGKAIDAAVWAVLVCCNWLVHQCQAAVEWWLDAVLGTWEESLKAVIRESFAQATRLVNGIFAWLLAVFAESHQSWHHPFKRSQAWQAWWRENRPSTFNAIIARDRTSSRLPSPYMSSYSTLRSTFSKGGSLGRSRSSAQYDSDPPLFYRLSHALFRVPGFLWSAAVGKAAPEPARTLRRNGSDLFDRPSGWAVSEQAKKRGLLEDIRLQCEVMVTSAFDNVRWLIRCVLLMPHPDARPQPADADLAAPFDLGESWEEMAKQPRSRRVRRSASFSSWESLRNISSAGDIIRAAGYPLEEHTVTTSDGYIQQMERIPRHGARDVVFFMHGVFDTSMGWVSNGVTGSQAFAAYDQGFDVWLGNSRANPPRSHIDPDKMGAKYWHYTVNELGLEDVTAQIDHIHVIKCGELNIKGPTGMVAGPLAKGFLPPSTVGSATIDAALGMRRSLSDTALDGASALVPDPLPTGPNAAASLIHAGRRSSQDPAEAESSTSYGSPVDTVSSSVGPRAARSAMSARLKQEGRGGLRRCSKSSSPEVLFRSLQHAELAQHLATSEQDVKTEKRQHRSVAFLADAKDPLVAAPPDVADVGSFPIPIMSEDEESVPDGPLVAAGENAHGRTSPLQPPHSSASSSAGSSGYDTDGDADAVSISRLPAHSAHGTHSRQRSAPLASAAQENGKRRQELRLDLHNVYGSPAVQGRGPPRRQRGPSKSPRRDASAAASETEACTPGRSTQAARQAGGTEGPVHSARTVEAARAHLAGVPEAYRLRAVGHSLGGASLLIYLVMCRRAQRPHHLYRLILLTPAGFLRRAPKVAWPFMWFLPPLMWLNNLVRPGKGAAVFIPSSLLRYLTFKLTVDLQQIPALQEVTRAGLRLLLNGDASQWDRAMQMPHYNTHSMPAVSLHTGAHLIQWCRSGQFLLYDYGSAARNMRMYNQPTPPDIAGGYGKINIPVDIVAGRMDGVIAPQNVRQHYQCMKAAGCNVTFREFNFGHLDFTFAYKDDLRHFVVSRLLARH